MAKPGVMFYFEVRPCLRRLNLEEKGALFEAILDYGEFGVVPELEGMSGLAWDFLQPKLDRDSQRYDRVTRSRNYGIYCREARRSGAVPLSSEQWQKAGEPAYDAGREDMFASADDCEHTPTDVDMCEHISTDVNRCEHISTDVDRCEHISTDVIQTTNLKLQTTNPKPQTTNSKLQTQSPTPSPAAPGEKTPFAIPDYDQVKDYCDRNGIGLDVQRFMDYYSATGWRMGSKPMRDWQAAVRLWNGKEQKNGEAGIYPWDGGTVL